MAEALLDPIRRLLVRLLQIDPGAPEVPLGEHPEVFRASPRHLTYLLVLWALRTTFLVVVVGSSVGAAVAGLAHEGARAGAVALGVGAAVFVVGHALVSYAALRLDYEMRWYVLTDRALRIREGIVLVREVTLTLANVQELKVSQGPLQRLLGLTDLVVDTAGGGGAAAAAAHGSVHGHHGILRGVDGGGDLRERIASRVKQRRGAGLGDPDEHVEHVQHVDTGDDAFVAALRAVRDEARALRAAVDRGA